MIAAVCVPLMLFPKPILSAFKNSHKKEFESLPIQEKSKENQDEGDSILFDDSVSFNDDSDEGLMGEDPKQKGKHSSDSKQQESENGNDHHDENFGELMVHQLIEVIEFVLGSVSNTASYLRLWALSLAHSQLAEVFFSMLLEKRLHQGSMISRAFGVVLGFFMLANVTFAVLMCMDLMECFLHALRLHW